MLCARRMQRQRDGTVYHRLLKHPELGFLNLSADVLSYRIVGCGAAVVFIIGYLATSLDSTH